MTNTPALSRWIVRWLCAAALVTSGVVLGPPIGIPSAAADCPDIEVVFARGMTDPPGPGPVGAAFADSLRAKVGGRSVGVYGVNYPATINFLGVADGVVDANNRINDMTMNCPGTRLVLGGFSEGAAVMDMLLLGAVPGLGAIPGIGAIPSLNTVPGLDAIPGLTNVPAMGAMGPLPPNDHIAAVAVFANPLDKVSGSLGTQSPVYGGRTIDLCHANDPVCGDGNDVNSHHLYVLGLTDRAASYVAGLV
ncbi:MAG: cutinase family protein [Candidatus Sericytochromatia bacterium]